MGANILFAKVHKNCEISTLSDKKIAAFSLYLTFIVWVPIAIADIWLLFGLN